MLHARQAGVPVVVVGNITVGGTGKTPVAAWLARQLSLRGHKVGVVLRGYGGRASRQPRVVTAASDPSEVGDEAVLHALRQPHVVVVGTDRVAAASRAGPRAPPRWRPAPRSSGSVSYTHLTLPTTPYV